MPVSRYEIRNEFSLADRELYQAADKDDPEALLEGVAMAGLVGVLRQLGDLAEFAAEIFHNLHEEVMVTATRGHALVTRVQQLETEVPSIEKAFLSKTDHSSFFYHAGLDWHPSLRIGQNLVTQGDLPRFVMDSYEECRGPPRLFLLDKFDVAGAGACLKRYSDPSFYKVEASRTIDADVQREKKIRKAKKKGPRWRNGETLAVLPSSHSKLHQLFLADHVENGTSNPSHHARPKRRLDGFPFDSKVGNSYMEKVLKSPSPDQKVLHEITLNSLPQMLATNDYDKSEVEVLEVDSVGPDKESVRRKRSPSPDKEKFMLNPPVLYDEPNEVPVDDRICKSPDPYPEIVADGNSSTLHELNVEKVIAADAESDRDGFSTDFHSDDVTCEMVKYVRLPSTMGSEMATDSKMRFKSDFTSSYMNNQLTADASEEHLHTRISDSQSSRESTISDEENNSPRKEMSSSTSSNSPSTAAENLQSQRFSAEGFPSIPEIKFVDALPDQETADEDSPVVQHSKPVVSDDACTDTDVTIDYRPHFEPTSNFGCIDASAHPDSEVVGNGRLKGPESYETISDSDEEENKKNLAADPPYSPSVSNSKLQSGDASPRSSAGEYPADEPNSENPPWISPISDSRSVKLSADLLHEDESDLESQNSVENIASALDTSNVLCPKSNGTPEIFSTDNPIQGKLEDEVAKLPENFPSDCPDVAHNGADIEPMVSKGENPVDNLPENLPEDFPSYNSEIAHNGGNIESTISRGENVVDKLDMEDSIVLTDSPKSFPCITDGSLENKLDETSLPNNQSVDAEDNHSVSSRDNRNSSDDIILSDLANSPDWPHSGLDAHNKGVIPEEEATGKENLALEFLKSCEAVGPHRTEVTDHVSSNGSAVLESSCCTPENLEELAGTSDPLEKDGVILCTREIREISGSADLKSLEDVASAVPVDSENAKRGSINLPMDLNETVEEQIPCFEDSGLDEREDERNCLSGSDRESGSVEEVGREEGLDTDFCNNTPASEGSGTLPNFEATAIQSLPEQSALDAEQKSSRQSDLGNHIADAPPLFTDHDIKESSLEEQIELPPNQLDQELLDSGKRSADLSPVLTINHQKMLDYDDHDGDNDSAPPVHCPLVLEVPSLSTEYPKDSLGSIFPPNNPFSETTQINLADLAPLPPLPPVQWWIGKLQHASTPTEGETTEHKELFSEITSPPTTSTNEVSSSNEHINHSPIQIAPETTTKTEKVENSFSCLDENSMHETTDLTTKIENKQQQSVGPTPESEVTSPAEEDGVANGNRTVKLPLPHNPVIDSVATLDKIKLRKVTEQVRPEIKKVDEKDSFLEQIRSKSFNLRPAVQSRPSIRVPRTNLNVAAILEKANAIRQAFAGSDEDDEDNWSD